MAPAGDDIMEEDIFSGLVIAGFSTAMVGPMSMKFFADYGATVVRVESQTRPCVSRTSPPFKGGRPGLNRSGYFNHFNANMYSMALNMKSPGGRDMARRLIARSDVVMENNRPGVMERWGLGYEDIRKIREDIIMVRQNGFGTEGPYRDFGSYGMTLAAMAGIPNFIGWPDRGPLPVGVGAYTDCISPRYAAVALTAALAMREKTGKGQLIELAQFETAISFILPGVLDYAVNHREPVRTGNAHPWAAPHNVYPCRGEESWCTLAVFDEAQWASACTVIGKPEWIEDERFQGADNRKRNEILIDAAIGEFTLKTEAEDVMHRMQAAGVPAGVVRDPEGLYNDPQLRTRNCFWPLDHSEMGIFTHLGTSFEMSRTPGKPKMPSPCLGEHTEYVCTHLLGLSDEEFVELLGQGVFE